MGTVVATDPDGDTFTYVLTNADGGPFVLHPTTGVLTVSSGSSLNFEVKSSYNLTVSAQETVVARNSPFTVSMAVNVTLRDVLESPYFVGFPSSYAVDEESVYPAIVTPKVNGVNGSYIVVNDEDNGNNSALVVSVVSTTGQGSGYFEVVNAAGGACLGGQSCVLRVKSGAPRINYDSPSSLRLISVTLTVTDPTALSTTLSTFNVAVVDINQGTSA